MSKGFVIKDRQGHFWLTTYSPARHTVETSFIQRMSKRYAGKVRMWKYYYNKGFRIVKVQITEV